MPFEAWPTDTFFTDRKEVFFNGEAVQVLHQPAAHTDGDSIVFFRRSDVISTGDIFLTTRFPYIDRDNGGTLQGIIDALNRIIDLTVPADRQEGGTMVIPGRGRLCDEADVVEYRDMLTIIRDRIRYLVDDGASPPGCSGCKADAGLRWPLWGGLRILDHGAVRHGDLRGNEGRKLVPGQHDGFGSARSQARRCAAQTPWDLLTIPEERGVGIHENTTRSGARGRRPDGWPAGGGPSFLFRDLPYR